MVGQYLRVQNMVAQEHIISSAPLDDICSASDLFSCGWFLWPSAPLLAASYYYKTLDYLFLFWQVSWRSTLLWPSAPLLADSDYHNTSDDLPLRIKSIFILTGLMTFHSAWTLCSANYFAEEAAWPVCHCHLPAPPLWTHVLLPQFTLRRMPHDLSALPICRRLHYEHMFCFRNSLCGGRHMTCLPFPSANTSVMNTRSAFTIHFAELPAWPVCHSHLLALPLWTHIPLPQFTLRRTPHDPFPFTST